ncbi:MAG TPA: hypothetical protein VGP99_13770 [Tepidisphaeraceae bacterium]|jgi:hypothetical protein|nr:hypothetical protein [Tepidisphaeraceae bacterium]
MTRFFVLLAVVMLAVAPLSAAPKDKKDKKDDKSDNRRPSGNEIADEANKARFDKERAIEKRYGKGSDVVRFVPAHLAGQTMGDFARGAIVGLLDIDRKGDLTGLPAGKYHVYVKEIKGDWVAFYEKDGHITKDAVGVHFDQDGKSEPKFKDGGDCVLYSHWEFCY